jgi:hypothetical protein
MFKRSVGWETSQRLKGLPPATSALDGRRAVAGSDLESLWLHVCSAAGDADKVLRAKSKMGMRIVVQLFGADDSS